MNNRHSELIDLISDPICLLLMKRDGVQPLVVLRLMKSVRPRITQDPCPEHSMAA